MRALYNIFDHIFDQSYLNSVNSVAVCSEMVLTGFTNNRFILTRLALLLERYIQQADCVL